MISLFNGIVRRGHCPRELAIQRLMKSLGLEIVPNAEEVGSEDDELSELSEAAESSVATDDEEVEVASSWPGTDSTRTYVQTYHH